MPKVKVRPDVYFIYFYKIEEVKLILRPLSDMTEEEAGFEADAAWKGYPTILVNAEVTKYLLSKGFDLFNLIESSLAIDATKFKEQH